MSVVFSGKHTTKNDLSGTIQPLNASLISRSVVSYLSTILNLYAPEEFVKGFEALQIQMWRKLAKSINKVHFSQAENWQIGM